mmetsp:Transcript_21351/g.33029  ORF Transcript_21351/g.33029 Transcript_21351/m.33029 type:complete len:109 (+) Transcript_21351:1422-1748(+)
MVKEDSYKSLVYNGGPNDGLHISSKHLQEGGELLFRSIMVHPLICEGLLFFEIEFDLCEKPVTFQTRISPTMTMGQLIKASWASIKLLLDVSTEDELAYSSYYMIVLE